MGSRVTGGGRAGGGREGGRGRDRRARRRREGVRGARADVRLGLDEAAVVELVPRARLLVRADDLLRERLHHEERLAERPRALPQHLVGAHRDDRAEREDERVHVRHVEVVGGDGVGDGIRRHPLRLLLGELHHLLGVHLWVEVRVQALVTGRCEPGGARGRRCCGVGVGGRSGGRGEGRASTGS